MKQLRFYIDVISPYAFLAFQALPQVLEGCSHRVEYQPVFLPGLLRAFGQKGPAEIPAKNDWMRRHVAWVARSQPTPLQFPGPHPFNPLALLRLLLACAEAGQLPNRWAVETVLRYVWQADGADPNHPARLAALEASLGPRRDPNSAEVKEELRLATEAAVALGVFGVPMIEVLGGGPKALFWGLEGLPLLRASLLDGPAHGG
jgi:2-hydroxychromene-2-carboxylate isomerase